MTEKAKNFLLPLQENDYDRHSIDFHNLPPPLPVEVVEQPVIEID